MKGISGKIAIVTGASRGIGAAIALRLAEEGADIVVNYASNEKAAEEVGREIEKRGQRAIALKANLAEPAEIRALFEAAHRHFGRLDILVNNAGVAGNRPLTEMDAEFIDQLFDLNVRALTLCMAEAARRMEKGGRIVNLSSVAARLSRPGGGVYSATKAAVEALTRGAAVELGPREITVNAVAPGVIETDMLSGLFRDHQDELKTIIAVTPLGRVGQPEDIADVVAFLASDEARWVTGQSLTASGGR